ncbi:MAG: dihydrofolate reductase [Bacteroidota bacterium]
MKLIIIAALARNRVIGSGGKLPWHLPDDLKRFKRLTTGHTILMGRKTYESLGKALPDRRNVVLTSHPLSGVETYRSLGDALEALEQEDVVYVIGGGKIFNLCLPVADGLYLTHVDREVEGDTFFPEFEHLIGTTFKPVWREEHDGFTFVNYVKTGNTPH